MTTPAEQLAINSAQSQVSSIFADKMGLLSVKSFGAKGNGITNDTNAILAAKDFANAKGYKSLFFPHGVYVGDTILGTALTGLYLWGDNSSFSGVNIPINQVGANLTAVHEFLELQDAPKSFDSHGGKVVAIKSDETALEFINLLDYYYSKLQVDTKDSAIQNRIDKHVTGQAENHVGKDITLDPTGKTKITAAELQTAIDQIENEIKQFIGVNVNAEVGDAHISTVKGKTFDDVKARFEEAESQLADYAKIRKINFKDAWIAWQNGEKFPIAFFGDSTIDGQNTTGWSGNSIGTDHQPPNGFTTILQNLIREETGSAVARIYNAGFSGQTANWGLSNIDSIFAGSYSDVKMIGIGFGINDRLVTDVATYESNFRTAIESIIKWCYDHNIQPFLLTTQAIIQPATSYPEYPLRNSESINSVANRVKRELALKNNLEIIDINYYTEYFLHNCEYFYSQVISDSLHFNDIGHKFEAELLFSFLCPRVIWIEGNTVLDFASQKIKTVVADGNVQKENSFNTIFKTFAYYDKTNVVDELSQDFLVFNLTKGRDLYQFVIQNKKNEFVLPATDTQKPYVLVNGVKTILNNIFIDNYFDFYMMYAPYKICTLKVGLTHIQHYTGQFNRESAAGFYITDKLYEGESIIKFLKISSGTTHDKLSQYENYVENDCIYKLELTTNCAFGENLFIPLIDKRICGIGLNINENYISLMSYTGALDDTPTWTVLNIVYNYDTGVNSKTQLKEFYVKVTNNNTLSVYQNLNDASPLLQLTITGRFGGYWIAHYIYTNETNVAINTYGILKSTRLA